MDNVAIQVVSNCTCGCSCGIHVVSTFQMWSFMCHSCGFRLSTCGCACALRIPRVHVVPTSYIWRFRCVPKIQLFGKNPHVDDSSGLLNTHGSRHEHRINAHMWNSNKNTTITCELQKTHERPHVKFGYRLDDDMWIWHTTWIFHLNDHVELYPHEIHPCGSSNPNR